MDHLHNNNVRTDSEKKLYLLRNLVAVKYWCGKLSEYCGITSLVFLNVKLNYKSYIEIKSSDFSCLPVKLRPEK